MAFSSAGDGDDGTSRLAKAKRDGWAIAVLSLGAITDVTMATYRFTSFSGLSTDGYFPIGRFIPHSPNGIAVTEGKRTVKHVSEDGPTYRCGSRTTKITFEDDF